MDDILTWSAARQVAAIRAGDMTAERLMQATLARVAEVNGRANAIVSLRDGDALVEEARAADARHRVGGASGALHGLPVAIKDLAEAAGLPTSQGSPLFAGQVAARDDPHVARMRAAGAIVIGKTNAPEFGLGSNTYNPVFGTTGNPYDPTRSCGGSSGGAAVALALRMLAIADGSDMMGSLRNPAGWCNVYGMRPSWGLVPGAREGDSFLHQISTDGPMARNPADLALLLGVMAGPDPAQPHGLPMPDLSGVARAKGALAGARLGWLGDWGGALPFEDGILDLCEAALATLRDLDATVETLPPPFPRDAIWDSWTTLRAWKVAAGLGALADDPGARDRLKAEAQWEIARGRALSAMDVHAASVIRSDWFAAAADLFDRYDALLAPTAQVWPFPLSMAWPDRVDGQAMDSYHRWMEVVVPASLAGLPVVTLPAGFGAGGLPMGLQLIGRRGADAALLRMAQAWHAATGWPDRRPPPDP